jgi:hypothetical protein
MRNIFDDSGTAKLALAILGTGLALAISEASIVPLVACGLAVYMSAWAARFINRR